MITHRTGIFKILCYLLWQEYIFINHLFQYSNPTTWCQASASINNLFNPKYPALTEVASSPMPSPSLLQFQMSVCSPSLVHAFKTSAMNMIKKKKTFTFRDYHAQKQAQLWSYINDNFCLLTLRKHFPEYIVLIMVIFG